MSYKHGIEVVEQATSLTAPVEGTAGLQVIFGTAPVNLAEDPYAATNVPILAYTYAEAVAQLGYSEDFKSYTICQSMDACFKVLPVAPVIFINVLDPAKHTLAINETEAAVESQQAVLKQTGILTQTLEVRVGEEVLEKDTDYITSFDDDGYVVVSLTSTGKGADAESITYIATAIDPGQVEASDIIGGYNAKTGKETGLELVRQIYPKFGMVPGLLLAPGWSQKAEVAVAIGAKCEDINGLFTCEAIIDLDSSEDGATKYTDCYELKNKSGLTNKYTVLLWPQVKIGEKQYAYSAIFGALTAYTDANNDDVPYISPSNESISISGTVLEDGTEVVLDQQQANLLNGQGIITAINVNGWKSWGNNTACYPSNTDPKDRWFCCRRFFSWWAASFIQTYMQKVDDPMNKVLIESIVDSENIRANAYVSQGKCAGATIEYNSDDNPTTEIINGHLVFRQKLAPFVPAEYIQNLLEFDPDMLESALSS